MEERSGEKEDARVAGARGGVEVNEWSDEGKEARTLTDCVVFCLFSIPLCHHT